MDPLATGERRAPILFGVMLGRDQADAVWDVLVKEAGAREDDRDHFVHSTTYNGLSEYRFGGLLGFGGKVRWARGRGLYVDAYPEDMNDFLRGIIDLTNDALAKVGPQP